jgi:hypothetical protein
MNLLGSSGFGLALAGVWFVLNALVHIAFAAGVHHDSDMLVTYHSRQTRFVSGRIWTLAALLGGVFVAAAYWAIHHSTLRPVPPPKQG